MGNTHGHVALTDIVATLADRRVLVLGDIILDAYITGDVTRISPEAPVPVLEVVSDEYRLGGAANVAANARSLGADVALVGTAGEDGSANELLKLLNDAAIDAHGIVPDESRPTSLKTRIIARTQQIVRLDRESRRALSPDVRADVQRMYRREVSSVDAVIVADYDKGLLDAEMIVEVRTLARSRGIPVVVDPKVENFRHYGRVTCITPNTNEAGAAAGLKIESVEDVRRAGARLVSHLELDHLLITRGPEGMSLFERANDPGVLGVTHIPTVARRVFDVTGAGDTVVAVYGTALAVGARPVDAARLANYAAGITVAQMGCATVSLEQLREVLAEREDSDTSAIEHEQIRL